VELGSFLVLLLVRVGGSVYFHMVEPEQAEAIASVLRPGDVFIDIGANVGFYTILASKRVGEKGRVYAIEPFLRNLFLFIYPCEDKPMQQRGHCSCRLRGCFRHRFISAGTKPC
jgi:hypothetical protein